jgi:hypothetical protein
MCSSALPKCSQILALFIDGGPTSVAELSHFLSAVKSGAHLKEMLGRQVDRKDKAESRCCRHPGSPRRSTRDTRDLAAFSMSPRQFSSPSCSTHGIQEFLVIEGLAECAMVTTPALQLFPIAVSYTFPACVFKCLILSHLLHRVGIEPTTQ